MLWPVRCQKCAPNPRATITARAASSASPPRTGTPAAIRAESKVRAASRASRTASHTVTARDDGAPIDAIHVWSAYTPPFFSRAHRSISNKSPLIISLGASADGA